MSARRDPHSGALVFPPSQTDRELAALAARLDALERAFADLLDQIAKEKVPA